MVLFGKSNDYPIYSFTYQNMIRLYSLLRLYRFKINYNIKNLDARLHRYIYWRVFGVIFLSYSLIAWISQEFIYNEFIYYRSYSENFSHGTIESILGIQERFKWMSYVLIPVTLTLKFLFTSLCISIGKMFSEAELEFKIVFKSVTLAEIIFIIAQVIFMIILYLNLDDITLQNASGYFPLSALSLIGIDNINAQWAIYPLQTANLFEVFYVIAIAYLLSRKWKHDFFETINIVIPSYGVGLLLWVTLVAFLALQVS